MTKKNARAEALAARIEQGAAELAAFAEGLSESEWRKPCNDRDRRTLGVLVHHVGTMYPIEVEAAKAIASGKSVDDVSWEVVAGINAKHSAEHGSVTPAEAVSSCGPTAARRRKRSAHSPTNSSTAPRRSR